MRSTKGILGIALAVVLAAASACGSKGNMAEKQKAAFAAQKVAITAEVDKVLNGWVEDMARTIPEDVRKFEKSKSPLVRWRLDTFKYDWRRPLTAAVVPAKGTVVEKDFEAIPDFFDTMEKFWKKEVDFKDYMAAYDKLKKTCDDPVANLLADFDHAFVHLEAFYGAQDMDGDDRAVYFFRHWQVAFGFPREKGEAVSEYLARLCANRMGDFCKTVPFESVHFALERPYLTEVKRMVGEYLTAHPDAKVNKVFASLLTDVATRLTKIPTYSEDPIMVDSIAKSPYVGDSIVTVTKKGLLWEERDYLSFDKGWTLPAKEWAVFGKAVASRMPDMEKERGPENLETLLVSADKDAAMSIPAALVEIFKKQPPRYVAFGGRRRLDNMNRRTTFGKLTFREVPIAPRKVDVEGLGAQKCRPLGQVPDAVDLPGSVGPTVWVGVDGLKAGTFAGGKVTGLKTVSVKEAVAHLKTGTGLILAAEGAPISAFTAVLEPLFLECGDPNCSFVKDQQPRLEVQVCGK
jgi:hypothetical protein